MSLSDGHHCSHTSCRSVGVVGIVTVPVMAILAIVQQVSDPAGRPERRARIAAIPTGTGAGAGAESATGTPLGGEQQLEFVRYELVQR